jgi:uncharacterized membrane protein YeaQ/YmgE (transglycosylase-associated protein family)
MADLVSFFIFILIGLLAGWLADVLVPGIGFGLLGDLIVGVIGALLGGFLFGSLIPIGGMFGSFITALLGAIILLLLIKLIRRA